MGSSNTAHGFLMMFTTWLCLFLWKKTLQDGIKHWGKMLSAKFRIPNKSRFSFILIMYKKKKNVLNGVQLDWWLCRNLYSTTCDLWYWCELRKEQYWVGNTFKEVDVVKTIPRHLSVSTLGFLEVFRIRSRKVMISEIRLGVIHQRMGTSEPSLDVV